MAKSNAMASMQRLETPVYTYINHKTSALSRRKAMQDRMGTDEIVEEDKHGNEATYESKYAII